MVQLIRQFFNSLTFTTNPSSAYYDNVDPNIVRYFRTEYGRDWQGALNEHLYNLNKKGLK